VRALTAVCCACEPPRPREPDQAAFRRVLPACERCGAAPARQRAPRVRPVAAGRPQCTYRRCPRGLIWCLCPLFCAHRISKAPTPGFRLLRSRALGSGHALLQPCYRWGALGLGLGDGPDRCLLRVRAAAAAGARSSRFPARAASLRALRRSPCTPAGAPGAACRCGATSMHLQAMFLRSDLVPVSSLLRAQDFQSTHPRFQTLALSSPGERARAPAAALPLGRPRLGSR